MELNFAKCVIIPLFLFLETEVREKLLLLAPQAAEFVIAKIAKYFGIFLGPNARGRSWQNALRKFLKAAMNLKVKHPPLMGLARIYNSDVFPILMYQAQFWEPPKEALELEKHVVMSITSYPYHSVKPEVLHSLDKLQFPLTFNALETSGLAARYRMQCTFIAECEDYKVQIAAAGQSDELSIGGHERLRGWRNEGILTDLMAAREKVLQITELPQELDIYVVRPPTPQKKVTKLLHDAFFTKSAIVTFFLERLRHWFDDADERDAEKYGITFKKLNALCPHTRKRLTLRL